MIKECSVILLDTLPDKKIKSLGNRCLIQLKKNTNILDYHISILNKIFYNPEIILSCGFENKKIKKYLSNKKYTNIKYLEYDMNDTSNIGACLKEALRMVKGSRNYLIMNTNHILHSFAINKIKEALSYNNSFIMHNSSKGDIGVIINNDRLINCYYDLPNSLYDILYINKKDFDIFNEQTYDISKLYLFEIINYYIERGMELRPIRINNKAITVINNMQNIERVKNQLCLR
jgi:NDP-sugar pyrophosphorylase family protein